jgi:hypothetical protein
MRHIGIIAALFFSISLSASAGAQVTVIKDTDGFNLKVSIDQIDWQTFSFQNSELSFTKPQLRGDGEFIGTTTTVGAPEIPVIRKLITADNIVVISNPDKKRSFTMSNPISPKQASEIKIEGTKKTFLIDMASYSESKFIFGGAPYSIEKAGSIRGIQQYLLTLHPIDYNPVTGETIVRKEFSVKYNEVVFAKKEFGPILFVVGNKFKNSVALSQYKTYKEAKGHSVFQIVYGQDANSVNSLRTAIKSKYTEHGIDYVVIVGDASDVPGKSARHMSGVTDHYYRAIDTDDYESDINGPDVGLGRISVNNENQLQAVVDKYVRYQNSAKIIDPWEMKISFLGTSDSSYYQVAEATHNYVIETHTRDHGYVGNFPAARTLGGDTLYAISNSASGSDVMSMANQGRNFITYSGHGYTGGWAGPSFNSSNIRNLSDENVSPFVLGFACDTGDYRGNTTFAETWTHHPAGAILYWGSMDSSYWDEDDVLERRLYDGVFDGLREFGNILNNALSQHWAHYGGGGKSKYYWETYHTFGDPSVRLRTGI